MTNLDYLIFSVIVLTIVAAWSIRDQQEKEDRELEKFLKRRK